MNSEADRNESKRDGSRNDISLVYGVFVLFVAVNAFMMTKTVITALPLVLLPVYLLFRKSKMHRGMGVVMILIGLMWLSLVVAYQINSER